MHYTVYYGEEKEKDFQSLDDCIVFCYYLCKECDIDYAYIKSHYNPVDFVMDSGYVKPLFD